SVCSFARLASLSASGSYCWMAASVWSRPMVWNISLAYTVGIIFFSTSFAAGSSSSVPTGVLDTEYFAAGVAAAWAASAGMVVTGTTPTASAARTKLRKVLLMHRLLQCHARDKRAVTGIQWGILPRNIHAHGNNGKPALHAWAGNCRRRVNPARGDAVVPTDRPARRVAHGAHPPAPGTPPAPA